ncbi:MAG: T9SS type A sorting domain-containing protein [Chitinophagaceae bacterium]
MIPVLLPSRLFWSAFPERYLQKFFHSLRKLNLLSVFVLTLTTSNTGHSQVNGYSFSTSTGNALETGGFTNLLGTSLDDDVSAVTNIGFTFNYGGTDYTDFSATSNGLLTFGAPAVYDYNNYTSDLTGPYLAPYWDDNYTDVDGNVQYLLSGTPGSRKLVVEYNLSFLGNTGTADKHFQIWLFETTNNIMFVYGTGNNVNGNFSTGILTDGTTDFISVNSTTHASGTVSQIDNNTDWPGAGRAYTFSSTGGTLPVSFLNFSGYKDGTGNQLRWATANENNNLGFEVQRSADGINYSVLDFVDSKAVGGNSTTVLNYAFTDYNSTGIRQYYRLRQVDFDNRSDFSNIIIIEGEKPLGLTIGRLFPNPARSIVNVQITSPGKDKITVFIIDLAGRIVIQKSMNVEAGNNIVPLDISQLNNTNYMLKVTAAKGSSKSLKVLVSK